MILRYSLVYLVLLLLLALSVGTALMPLGIGNVVANLGIAAIKAALVAIFFMHLSSGRTLPILAALIIPLWLAIMFAQSFADYFAR